jgi:site-specific DNA-methyltransferase (adenine-specific)
MAAGKGLDKFREKMLSDRRMKSIVDFPKLYEGFPGVKIRGGISYFIWDRAHSGPCQVQTIWDGQPTGPIVSRYLDAYDILVRRNEAVPILDKVKLKGEPTLDSIVSSRKPFGLATNFRGKPTASKLNDPVKLFENQKTSWIERDAITVNSDWVNKWKVLMTRVQGTSAAIETKFLSKPIIAEPGTACTETYLVAGHFETEDEAVLLARYLSTRFVRFLVSLRKPTQDAARGVYGFVPAVPLTQEWSDELLYKRYAFTEEEINFIESQVAAHGPNLSEVGTDSEKDDD